MTNYDFQALSPKDFEHLSRDLLEAELGGSFESFTSGPDSGIDSRRLLPTSQIVVQCKHYCNSPFRTLFADIRNRERKHILDLPPRTRYILATSMGLTPANKDKLFEILQPHCASPADIFGKDDINDLLTKYPAVEERHHKLWLTSTATLQRVIHSRIVTDSVSHLEDVRRRLARYVPNASLNRAQEILDEHHICIISGIPGIGKTTLAEVLVTQLVDKDDFAPFRIGNKLDEIKSIKDKSRKQVFYFDDFLGRTDLIHPERNEDRDLQDLIRQVAENDLWRLILTTREYILNAAKARYEAIHQLPDGFARCIVDLGDYTLFVRAQILYNHIYFSDLPKSHKLAILENFSYRKIIDHHNFIPRLIDWMTGYFYTHHTDAKEYLVDFQTNLDDPKRIWEYAFLHQISEASQHLILILATLPSRVYEEDAHICFREFRSYRRKKYGDVIRANDWDTALRELDGSFLATVRAGGRIAIQFHNPSVEDFVKEYMGRTPIDVDDLLASIVFFEQFAKLWTAHKERLELHDTTFERLKQFVPGRQVRTVSTGSGLFIVAAIEEQVRFLMRVAKRMGRNVAEAAGRAMTILTSRWQKEEGDRSSCLALLLDWQRELGSVPEVPLVAAKNFMIHAEYHLEDFDASAKFVDAFPSAASEEELELLAAQFDEVLPDICDGQSVDDLLEIVEVVERVGNVLEMDVENILDELNENIEEMENKVRQQAGHRPTRWESEQEERDEMGTIDTMFADLRDLLASS